MTTRSMRIATELLLAGAVLAAGGCGGDGDCKNACDVVVSCDLKSSGLSCDETCDQGDCAACVNDSSCGDIESGACNDDCPGVSFSKDDKK